MDKRFVVAVLCPNATFNHLLQEAHNNNLTILEMIPFQKEHTDLSAQIDAGRSVLFIYSNGTSLLAHAKEDILQGLSCC